MRTIAVGAAQYMGFFNDADNAGRLPARRGSGSPCNARNGADTRVMAFTLDPWRETHVCRRGGSSYGRIVIRPTN